MLPIMRRSPAAALDELAARLSPHFNWQSIEPAYTPEYVAGLRRLTGPQKLEAAEMLYQTALSVKMAGLRRRHPDMSEAALRSEASRLIMLNCAAA